MPKFSQEAQIQMAVACPQRRIINDNIGPYPRGSQQDFRKTMRAATKGNNCPEKDVRKSIFLLVID